MHLSLIFLLWPLWPTWEQQWGQPWWHVTSEDISGSCPVSGQSQCLSLCFGWNPFSTWAAPPPLFTESSQTSPPSWGWYPVPTVSSEDSNLSRFLLKFFSSFLVYLKVHIAVTYDKLARAAFILSERWTGASHLLCAVWLGKKWRKLFQKYLGSFKCGFCFPSDFLFYAAKKKKITPPTFGRKSVILNEESDEGKMPSPTVTPTWAWAALGRFSLMVFSNCLGLCLNFLLCEMEMCMLWKYK